MNREELGRLMEQEMAKSRERIAALTVELRAQRATPAVPLLTPEGTVWQITTLTEGGDHG